MGDEYPASMGGGVGGAAPPPPSTGGPYLVDDMNALMLLTAAALLEMVATSRVIDLMSDYYPDHPHSAKADWVLFCACFTVFVVMLIVFQVMVEVSSVKWFNDISHLGVWPWLDSSLSIFFTIEVFEQYF